MATTTNPDIILNKANVALSRSQRIVSSWLPPLSPDEQSHSNSSKSPADLQKEEDEIFTPVPERLGLGAPLPQNTDGLNASELDSNANEKLRKQLLGKNYKRVLKEREREKEVRAGPSNANILPSADKLSPAENGQGEDEGEDEEGRASLVGKKNGKRKSKADSAPGQSGSWTPDDNVGQANNVSRTAPTARNKKAMSFLDEVLAERSKRRKKR